MLNSKAIQGGRSRLLINLLEGRDSTLSSVEQMTAVDTDLLAEKGSVGAICCSQLSHAQKFAPNWLFQVFSGSLSK